MGTKLGEFDKKAKKNRIILFSPLIFSTLTIKIFLNNYT